MFGQASEAASAEKAQKCEIEEGDDDIEASEEQRPVMKDLLASLKPRSPFSPVPAMQMPDFELEQSEAWMMHLRSTGVVRIRSVLCAEEVATAKALFWDWLEGLGGGAHRNEPSTWTDANFPGLLDKGFFCTRGGGQSDAAWAIRKSQRVHRAFAEIWGTDKLISSFDTFIGWRPWWHPAGGAKWKPRTEGIHCDQNPHTKPGLKCVQGMVPLRPVSREVGGLCVVPGSHTDSVQAHLCTLFPATKSDDWLPLEMKFPKDDLVLCGELIEAEPGDLILWDSRALHGGFVGRGPSAARKSDPGGLLELARLSLAVCMVPDADATQEQVLIRRNLVDMGLTTTHWPLGLKKQAGRDSNGKCLMPITQWQDIYKPPELDEWTEKLICGSGSLHKEG